MKHLLASGFAVFALGLGGCAFAQSSNPPTAPNGTRTFASVSQRVPQAAGDLNVREFRIKWSAGSAAPAVARPPAAQSATPVLVSERRTQMVFRRQRRPEISANDLVVVAHDAMERELDWRSVPDPRIVRAELPNAEGTLSGRTVQQPDAELMIAVPDVPGLDHLALYSPRWTGSEYQLEAIGEVKVGQ
jgi:hypothetical protein